MKIVHPVYGENESGWKAFPGYPGYSVNEHGHVRGKKKMLIPDQKQSVVICRDGKRFSKRIYHITLLSFFPHIQPMETVDHIDENHRNNHITNLQWSSRPDNIRKSNKLNPRNHGPARSKTVWLLDEKGETRVRRFNSATEASKVLSINGGNLRVAAKNGGKTKGMYFEYEEIPDLDGEVWTTSSALDQVLGQQNTEENKKIMVSNKGRIRAYDGRKKRGNPSRDHPKDRSTKLCGKTYEDHVLIFMGFHNQEAPKRGTVNSEGKYLYVLHNDDAPLDKDGCYRNYPEDLRIGTQNQNMYEYHAAKRRRLEAATNSGGDECIITAMTTTTTIVEETVFETNCDFDRPQQPFFVDVV